MGAPTNPQGMPIGSNEVFPEVARFCGDSSGDLGELERVRRKIHYSDDLFSSTVPRQPRDRLFQYR